VVGQGATSNVHPVSRGLRQLGGPVMAR
jgi:hypothetical protein